MKLVKFKDYRDEDIYVDPEAVVGVATGKVYLFGREECLLLKADADEIISKIGAEVDDFD